MMAFSSDIVGTEVFQKNEPFAEGKGTLIDGLINKWIGDDTLLVYNFKSELPQPRDTLPIKIECKTVGDFTVKTVYYKSNSSGSYRLNFDSVFTTRDSIFVRTLSGKKNKVFKSFPLGGTTFQVEDDTITHIEIEGGLDKSMDFIYKNENGTYTTGLPHIGIVTYDLSPTKKISAQSIDQKKIFWEEPMKTMK